MSKTMLQSIVKGHSPRLDTILEIENIMMKKRYFNSKTELYRSLKNKTQYGTLITILKYLEYSNKIEFNKDGSLIWIFLDRRNKSLLKTLKKSIPLT